VSELPASNYFFENGADRESTTQAIRAFLEAQPRDAEPTVPIAHRVNIAAPIEIFPRSLGGAVLALRTPRGFIVIGEIEQNE